MKRIIFLLVAFLTVVVHDVNAYNGKRYWISTGTSNFNNASNWSLTNGGAIGGGIPGASDTIYFTSTKTGQCTLDVNISVKRWEMGSGCGTFSQGAYSITVGTSGAALSGGTFTGGSAAITFSGACTISGTAFTSTSGTLSTNSNFTLSSGSFTHNSGRVKFTATCTVSGSLTLHKLEFNSTSTSTFTIASGTTLTVNDTLEFSGTAAGTYNTGSISAKGDVIVSNNLNGGGGSATLTINGTGSQSFVGGTLSSTNRMPNVVINKTSGTLTLSNVIAVAGNWTWTAGTLSVGSSTVNFIGTKTITGTHTLANVRLSVASTYTIASGSTLTTTGTLDYGSGNSGSIKINTGTINVQGNLNLKNPVTGGGGNGSIVINGSGNQTITGNAVEGYSALPNVTINKTSGTLTLDSVITVAGNWTYTAGTLSTTTSTVCFWDTKTITGSHSLTGVSFNGSTTATYTLGSTTTLTVTGLLSFAGSNQIAINSGTINAQGNISLSNSFNSNTGGGSTSLVINGGSNQSLTGNSTKGNSRLPNVTINKSGGTLSLYNTISVQGNFTHTAGTVSPGSSTIHFAGDKTISGTLTLYTMSFGASSNFTYNFSGGSTFTLDGDLETTGTSNAIINTGTINVHGNITVTNTGTGSGGSALVVLNGTGSQTITGSGTAGAGKLPNITIDKSSGTLSLSSVISVSGNWIYTQGTVSPGTSSVSLYGSYNLDGQGSSSTMSFYRLAIAGDTRTLTGNVDVNSDFTIASGCTCVAGTYTMNVGGNWNSQGTWTYGTSTIVFDGTGYTQIRGASGTAVNFNNVTLNRGVTTGSCILVSPVKINGSMTFARGRVKSSSTNYLEFADNATCTVSNDDSAYVCGPVRKTGNDAFTFPLGDTLLHDSVAYHPLAISAPGATGDIFVAQYHAAGQALGTTTVDSITGLSTSEYWNLDRQSGTSAVTVSLGWNRNSAPVSISDLRIASWNSGSSTWADLGQSSVSINWPTGTITATATTVFTSGAAVLTFSQSLPKYWGYATLKRKLDGTYFETKKNALYFRFDDEYNDQSHHLTYSIYNAANTDVAPTLVTTTNNQALSYYGDNRFKIDLWTNTASLPAGYYILEVRNEKNELFYLRFKKS